MKKLFNNLSALLLGVILFGLTFFYLKYQQTDYDSLISQAYKRKVQFAEFVEFDGEFEPDIPDNETNSKDYLGVDLNKNEIRDDIDIWIVRMGSNFNERMAMRQYAKGMQALQKDCQENKFSHDLALTESLNQSKLCLSVISDYEREVKGYGVSMLNILIVNTDLRKKCYQVDQSSMPGKVVSIELLKENCHFEVRDPKSIVEVMNIKSSHH